MIVSFRNWAAVPPALASIHGPLPGDPVGALALAPMLGARTSGPGGGATADLWETLATLAAHDLGVARAIEPHLDAVAILAQAGREVPTGTWGVFAAEGGNDQLHATVHNGRWTLNGTKPWCSLASLLDSALITAHTEDGASQLFAIDLSAPGVRVIDDAWHARGLTEIPSGPVAFADVDAEPIGEPGWYLTRPGFWWGGIGVAACWFGGAIGVARALFAHVGAHEDPHSQAHLGAVDTMLHACRTVLADAASQIDRGTDSDGRALAKRVRALIARTCEEVIVRAGHAMGPGAMTADPAHAKRIADLQVYIRQHHAERDDASLGRQLLASRELPW